MKKLKKASGLVVALLLCESTSVYAFLEVYKAVKAGKDIEKAIEQYPGDINSQESKEGETALMHAAKEGNLKVVEALIEAGADLTLENEYGRTAIKIAESVPVLLLLIKAYGDKKLDLDPVLSAVLDPSYGKTAYKKAQSNEDIFKRLLESVKVKGRFGKEYTEFLVTAYGYKPDRRGYFKEISKFLVTPDDKKARKNIAFKLLEAGVDPNVPITRGYPHITNLKRTALMLAAQEDDKAMIEALLKAGAKRGIKSEEGKIAQDYTNNPELKELLAPPKGLVESFKEDVKKAVGKKKGK